MSNSSWTIQQRRRLLGWSGDDSSDDRYTPTLSIGSDKGSGSFSTGFLGLTVADLLTSFLWTWGMQHAYVATGDQPGFNAAIYIAGRFLCAYASGGSTNPLSALTSSSSAAGRCCGVLPTIVFRVPAQVAGTIIGTWMFTNAFPEYDPGPFLQVSIYLGAAVQGVLAFAMAMVNLKTAGASLFQQTFISTMTRLVLDELSTGITNGWLNPASASGWAYLNGTHTTKEHLVVYWIAPVLATLLGVQLYDSFNLQEDGSGSRWKAD